MSMEIPPFISFGILLVMGKSGQLKLRVRDGCRRSNPNPGEDVLPVYEDIKRLWTHSQSVGGLVTVWRQAKAPRALSVLVSAPSDKWRNALSLPQ